MPTANDPAPYKSQSNIDPEDYFGHRKVSSPLIGNKTDVEAPSNVPQNITSPRKPIRSPLPSENAEFEAPPSTPPNVTIRRKPVGTPPIQRISPAGTTIHNKNTFDFAQTLKPHFRLHQPLRTVGIRKDSPKKAPPQTSHQLSESPTHQLSSFLDRTVLSSPADPDVNRATVISYPSTSKSRAMSRRPLAQNRSDLSPAKQSASLTDLPTVNLKDPITARLPSNSLKLQGPHQVWMPPTITKTEPETQKSSTTIPTTITTGFALPRHLPAQVDGPNESILMMSENGKTWPPTLQRKSSLIPLRTSSQQNKKARVARGSVSHSHPAAIATSSEHRLGQTKDRTQ